MAPANTTPNTHRVDRLIEKGACIACPQSVEIGPEVDIDRIQAAGLYIGAGSRLTGKHTFVGNGAQIGTQGPAVINDCQLAPDVVLASGTFEGATFLQGAQMGPNAQVRGGTLLEEQASGAHCVGLKQSILFPFVTLGSLVNFCDILMAGGTNRQNHSEVGSSYIHFNFTAHQDKATASLVGDVAHGVMLNQDPIFLGGQGGLVGPRRLAFGTISAAGTIVRKDELRPNRLLFGSDGRRTSMPYKSGQFHGLNRIVQNNCIYIANLMALMQWYRQVRSEFISDRFPQAVYLGALGKLDLAIEERIIRLRQLAVKIKQVYHTTQPESKALSLFKNWDLLQAGFDHARNLDGLSFERDDFLAQIKSIQEKGNDYLTVLQALPQESKALGSRWLNTLVEQLLNDFWKALPDLCPR